MNYNRRNCTIFKVTNFLTFLFEDSCARVIKLTRHSFFTNDLLCRVSVDSLCLESILFSLFYIFVLSVFFLVGALGKCTCRRNFGWLSLRFPAVNKLPKISCITSLIKRYELIFQLVKCYKK